MSNLREAPRYSARPAALRVGPGVHSHLVMLTHGCVCCSRITNTGTPPSDGPAGACRGSQRFETGWEGESPFTVPAGGLVRAFGALTPQSRDVRVRSPRVEPSLGRFLPRLARASARAFSGRA